MSSDKHTPRVAFNDPVLTGRELEYLARVIANRKFSGDGPFSKRANAWIAERFDVPRALVTTSGTHALEMAALLCDLGPRDEVILPSFGFSSTATAFVRCGAQLVFVDIDPRTMNIDPEAVEAAMTARTRVIVALHYAGVSCDMDSLQSLAKSQDALIVEDAAHAIFATYRGRPCGTLGDFGCFSFHETKNIQCGEGGALLVNDQLHADRAEIICEKGTDRARFYRGEVDKYTWRDIGSSFVLSELNSAFLLCQLEQGDEITRDRLDRWAEYHRLLSHLAEQETIEIPNVPESCQHNGHCFWIKTKDEGERSQLIEFLEEKSISSVFHYVPLHSTTAGRRWGRFHGLDRYTTREASRLLRLPLHYGFSEPGRVADAIACFYAKRRPALVARRA